MGNNEKLRPILKVRILQQDSQPRKYPLSRLQEVLNKITLNRSLLLLARMRHFVRGLNSFGLIHFYRWLYFHCFIPEVKINPWVLYFSLQLSFCSLEITLLGCRAGVQMEKVSDHSSSEFKPIYRVSDKSLSKISIVLLLCLKDKKH